MAIYVQLKEWRAIDISTVNHLVSFFKDRLKTCIHGGGPTNAPCLKHHLSDLSKIKMGRNSISFFKEVGQYLLQNSQQSWTKTPKILLKRLEHRARNDLQLDFHLFREIVNGNKMCYIISLLQSFSHSSYFLEYIDIWQIK